MKKTVKGFCISFALSSFAIWVANEVFSSVVPAPQNEIKIPQKNIALFFQKSDFAPHPVVTKQVATADLTSLKTIAKDEEELSEEEIAALTADVSEPIKIASIEDVADIPLEQNSVARSNKIIYQGDEPAIAETASRSPLPPITQETPKTKDDKKDKDDIIKIADAGLDNTPEVILPPIVSSSIDENETDIIPIEKSQMKSSGENIEVVNSAPQTQVAAVDKQISIDAMSIEVNDAIDEPKQREWQEMSEINNDPWVVAKANKFAKNSKAVEDYAAEENEAEIEKMLVPEKMEVEGKETQTARVAKNLLIPIPDEILNDENLTPQLVSPKKNLVKRDDEDIVDEDVSEEKDNKNKKGVWEKLTSIFSSSDEGVADEDVDSSTTTALKQKKIRRPIDNVGKNPSKILPAEMRLSFQPGRAEISGQTLRWVQAFANKAATSPNVILEIRIDKVNAMTKLVAKLIQSIVLKFIVKIPLSKSD